MKKKKPNLHIIGSLVEMTGGRDHDMITTSLVKTLFQLTTSSKIEMYEVLREHDSIILNHLAHMDDNGVTTKLDTKLDDFSSKSSNAILQCINKSTDITIDFKNNDNQSFIPVFDDKEQVVGILIQTGKDVLPENRILTKGVLQLYQNFRSLLDNSQKDPMTGLLNRETFVKSLNKIMLDSELKADIVKDDSSKRQPYNKDKDNYWLGLLDIDYFKRINDSYGHLYGDEVILLIVKLIRETFRKEDLFFRYGGEEFIVVVRVPANEDAKNTFERFRVAVESYKFGIAGQVTVSIGYVKIENKELPLSTVGKADKALYYAKEHGRNCVYDYTRLIEQGELKEDNDSSDIECGFESF